LALEDLSTHFFPSYKVQTFSYENYQISNSRFIELEDPYYNVNINNDTNENNDVNNENYKSMDYLFLLCDINFDDYNSNSLFKNIYNYTHNKFIYKFDEIPEYLNYLIFRSCYKYFEINSYFSKTESFKLLFDNYLMKYKNRTDNKNIKILPTIPLLSGEELKLRSKVKKDIYQKKSFQKGGDTQFNNNYININKSTNNLFGSKESKLSYYIIIDLELYPGKDGIPLSQKLVLGCQMRYEKIRQAWAKLFGLIYRPHESNFSNHITPSTVEYKKKSDSNVKSKSKP
jgi:hypothetical protein